MSPKSLGARASVFADRGVVWFIVLSLGLAWLLAVPLWLGEGLRSALGRILLPLMMLTPSVAAIVVLRWIAREERIKESTGLGLGRHWKRYWLLAWVGTPALTVGAVLFSAALGTYALDVHELSGFRAMLEEARHPGLQHATVRQLAVAQLLMVPLAPILNAPFALGEEWGWRGYLLGKLLPLGTRRALVLSGLIWGLWHAPIVLLGHNYPLHPRLGVLLMIVTCILLGILFGYMRLATGSIWPAVIAHGALNGTAGVAQLLSKAGNPVDGAMVGVTGWPGWLLIALVIAAGVLLTRIKRSS